MTAMNTLSLNTLFEKAGGRYALTVLVQKRVGALMKGGVPLLEAPPRDPFLIAIEEIRQEKISLAFPEKKKDLSAKTPS